MSRKSESEKAAKVLSKILDANPTVIGIPSSDRKYALELAISLLEARARDAADSGEA